MLAATYPVPDTVVFMPHNLYSKVITLADLESFYINSTVACQRLNSIVIPEIAVASLIIFILLLFQEWLVLLSILPIFLYLVYR